MRNSAACSNSQKGKKRASYIRSIISNKLNARSVVNFQYVTVFAVLTRAFTSLAAFTVLANACFDF